MADYYSNNKVSPVVVALVGTFGGLLFGYDTGIISPALEFIHISFEFNTLLEGLLTSSILVGAMVGSFAGGILTARLGRVITSYIACAICLFGTTASALSPDFWLLMVIRLILGSGIGLISVLCPLYVSESAPEDKRGLFGVIFQLSITFGILVAYVVGWGVSELLPKDPTAWRVMVGIGGIFPLALGILTFTSIKEGKSYSQLDNIDSPQQKNGGWGALFSLRHFKPLLTGIVLASTLQLTGINALMYYGPSILKKAGFDNPILLNISIGGWNFVTTFIAVFLVERLGRRLLMIMGTAAMSLALIVVGVGFLPQFETNETGRVACIATGLIIFLAGFEGGPGCLFWVLVNEIFPEEVKEKGNSFCNILQWAFNLLVSSLFKLIGDAAGFETVFFIFGGIGILCTLYMLLVLRETKTK